MDREKVIGHLNDCIEASRRDNTWVFVRKDIVEDAIALLKEQEQMYYTLEHDWKMCRKLLKEQEERIKSLEHQLETSCKL